MNKVTFLENALAQLRIEFIESTLERLDMLDNMVVELHQFDGQFDELFQDFLRHVHSIKGQGGTFDLASLSRVAHALEDFIETCPQIHTKELEGIQLYLDRMRGILEVGEDPPEDQIQALLRVATVNSATFSEQKVRVIDLLLVMPVGLQRKIIAQELGSCGFRVRTTERPLDALQRAINTRPDIVISNNLMDEISGVELARVLDSIDCTRGVKFMLLSSNDEDQLRDSDLPANTVIVRKGPHFSEDLTTHFIEWGMFGDLGDPKAASAS